MNNDRKLSESREEALERILAEAAAGRYRHSARPAVRKPVKKDTAEKNTKELTEAEKAAAAKARAAEKIAEIRRRKQLDEEKAEAKGFSPIRERQSNTVKTKIQENLRTENKNVRKISTALAIDEDENSFEELWENQEENTGEDKKKGLLYDILDIAECVIAAAFVVFLVFTYLIHIVSVQGTSMVPTLEDGDRIIVSALGYTPENGDVVVIDGRSSYLLSEDGRIVEKDGLGKSIVKRVIAKGGQTVDFNFETGEVFIDGKVQNEPYIKEITHRDEYAFDYPLEIPKGYVFVLGDNRNLSKDSRHPDVGLVSEEEIIGEAVMRIFPFGKFGGID